MSLDAIWQRLMDLERAVYRSPRACVVVEAAVDGLVRVSFPDQDNIESGWLQVLTVMSPGAIGDFNPPEVGTQGLALFLAAGIESGFFLGGMWDSTDDDQPSELAIRRIAGDKLELIGATHVHINAPEVQLGQGPPWYKAARGPKTRDIQTRQNSLLNTQGPLGNYGIPVTAATDLIGTDGVTAGGTIAVTAAMAAAIALVDSAGVEVD